jgi:hypothetical protein
MVVGPDWKGATPPGIKKVFRSTTQLSLAGYRTQLFNPGDLDNVKKVQAGYKVQTLSAYLNQPAPQRPPAIDFPKIDKELVKTNFFEYLDFALQFAPADANETEIRAQLARIGIGPGGRTVDSAVGCPRFRSNLCLEQDNSSYWRLPCRGILRPR